MGAVNSKGIVEISAVPVTFISIVLQLVSQLGDIQALRHSPDPKIVYGLFRIRHAKTATALTTVKEAAGALVPVLVYGRVAYHSLRAGKALPGRRRADLISLLLVVAGVLLQHLQIRPVEKEMAKQLETKPAFAWSPRLYEVLRTKLVYAKFAFIALAVLLILAQRSSFRAQ